MKYFFIIFTIQFFTIPLFSNNESNRITDNRKQEISNKIVGTWITNRMIDLIRTNKSIKIAYNEYTITEGYPLLIYFFNNDTLMRMLSEFHDSAYDRVTILRNSLHIRYRDTNGYYYNENILLSNTNEMIISASNKSHDKKVYKRVTNQYENADSIVNVFFINLLFNNKIFVDSIQTEFRFESNQIISSRLDTIKCSIEYDPLSIHLYNCDILYIGEKEDTYKFILSEDQLILQKVILMDEEVIIQNQEKEIIYKIKK